MPAGVFLLKVNYTNFRTRWEIYSKFTMKTPERAQRPVVIAGWGTV